MPRRPRAPCRRPAGGAPPGAGQGRVCGPGARGRPAQDQEAHHMRETQQKVAAFAKAYGLGTDPQARMLDLASEVGELAKEVLKATGYGSRPLLQTPALEEELGDCVFSLLCVSEALGLDGENALNLALEKYKARFAEAGAIGHRT